MKSMATDTNPLLRKDGVPEYASIQPEQVAPAIEYLIGQCDAAITQACATSMTADYDSVARLLDPPLQALSQAWGVVSHLSAVVDSPALRKVHAAAQPAVTDLFTRLSTSDALFRLYQRVIEENAAVLTPPQRKALDNQLRDFLLGGAELEDAAKERFAKLQRLSAEASCEFSNRLLDATDSFNYWASAEEMEGVPQDLRESLANAAATAGRESGEYKVTLQQACVNPLLEFAENRALRERLYRANVTRASEFGASEQDNTALIAELLSLRQERAKLLGFENFAQLSLVPKMASSSSQVLAFVEDLGARVRARARDELSDLRVFALEHLGLERLEAWDVAFASEKLREARYEFSDDEVKQYFCLCRVTAGLFEIAQTLFDVRIVADAQPVWHETVTAYRVERDGEIVGRLLLDPYARAGKRAGAWMNAAEPRWLKPDGEIQIALAYVVTNFTRPAPDRPALLSHSEVVTLFHEMGHALHFILSRVDVLGVSGISGVEWDAVELPSQLLENFAWDRTVLAIISAHTSSGAPLPEALFDRMLAARNFQSALQLARQVELSLFDMRLHAEPDKATEVQAVFDEVRAAHAVLPAPAYNRFQNGFSHVFSGGYAAGYYSYLWAEVLSADAWSVFEDAGVLDAATGKRYRQSVLERGGSRPMSENFREFAGRDPRVAALLEQRGLPAT